MAKWLSYTYTYSLFHILFHTGLSQGIEYCFLRCRVGPHCPFILNILLNSVQFSRSVVSDSLQPHGLQHTRPPCPSPTPRAYSNSCPLTWYYLLIPNSQIIPPQLSLPLGNHSYVCFLSLFSFWPWQQKITGYHNSCWKEFLKVRRQISCVINSAHLAFSRNKSRNIVLLKAH